MTSEETISDLLKQIDEGRPDARDRLFEVAYDELRQLASSLMDRERPEHTLQPTALVNEAAARLLRDEGLQLKPHRAYFFGAMTTAMRRVLVDHARRRAAERRGANVDRVPLDVVLEAVESKHGMSLLEFEDALHKLGELDPRIAEMVVQRFYGGYEVKEVAEQMGLSVSTLEKDWRFARAWLRGVLGAAE